MRVGGAVGGAREEVGDLDGLDWLDEEGAWM